MEKKFGRFPSQEKSGKNLFFGLLVWKRKLFSRLDLLTWILLIFYSAFDKINNFAFIVLTIIVAVFDLNMSFRKVKSGKLYSKLRNPALHLVMT